ncbi:hypothetical protein AcW1_002979 [Taiwanofungus camphoratus]|nr:hypothetical protein AcW1_002979 [Antrodia cinnamomea]
MHLLSPAQISTGAVDTPLRDYCSCPRSSSSCNSSQSASRSACTALDGEACALDLTKAGLYLFRDQRTRDGLGRNTNSNLSARIPNSDTHPSAAWLCFGWED